jgi:hypothetical protein
MNPLTNSGFVAILIALSFLTLEAKTKQTLQQKIKALVTMPCSKEFNEIKNDSIKSTLFIQKLEKETGLKFEVYSKEKSSEVGTTDYVLVLPKKSATWSIWFSINSKGIRHITESWQSDSEIILQSKLYESIKEIIETKGYFDEVDENNTFFIWNETPKDCGKTMITLVRNKDISFISRRIDIKF